MTADRGKRILVIDTDRRQKIEPLNYTEAAVSPALKSMTSFLDISSENVRNGIFHEFGPIGLKERSCRATASSGTPENTSPTGHKASQGEEEIRRISFRRSIVIGR